VHILYIHRAFPPQFAQVAGALGRTRGWQNTFISTKPDQRIENLVNIRYESPPEKEKRWDEVFTEQVRHAAAIARAVRQRPHLRPDLVVAHSGFGSSHLLPTVLDCPIINYFEYFTRPLENDMLFRTDFKHPLWYYWWRRSANAISYLDLATCTSGYSATEWQRSTFPAGVRDNIEVMFDGIDTSLFTPRPESPGRRIMGEEIPANTRVVTYIARGFEAVRGFDIFMKVARRIYTARPDTIFLVAGRDRVCYGTDLELLKTTSFKQWVFSQESYDLSKFRFLEWVQVPDLIQMLHLTDLHLFLTTPFVLSWSLFNALSCGATVLASNVAPVREVVRDGENGLLGEFFDIEGLARRALEVLDDPRAFHPLGEAGARLIREKYSLEVMLPRFAEYYERIARSGKPAALNPTLERAAT
jgi:glycosyltransferase involved in cell wall biosynthesis